MTEKLITSVEIPEYVHQDGMFFKPNAVLSEARDSWCDRFGVGDKIKYWQEQGMVEAIYEYSHRLVEKKIDVAVFSLENEKRSERTDKLTALTNSHVKFDLSKYPELHDVTIRFDPNKQGYPLQQIFNDDIARAIWLGFRNHHIATGQILERLNNYCLAFSRELKENPTDKKYLPLKFKRSFGSRVTPMITEEFAVFLTPYLTGERKLNVSIATD